jgi:hypothetical protein
MRMAVKLKLGKAIGAHRHVAGERARGKRDPQVRPLGPQLCRLAKKERQQVSFVINPTKKRGKKVKDRTRESGLFHCY